MLRELALRIALLTPEDRHWLLEQLPIADQKRVADLVDEAIEMGLTKNPSVISDFSSRRAQHFDGAFIEQAELSQLSLFWQNLIEAHQRNESQKKNLPHALMKSVISHARHSLHNDGAYEEKVYG